jgi:predicted outer membrane repeat protein
MKHKFISLSLVLVICASFALLTTQTAQGADGILRVKQTGTTTWPCGDTWANACEMQTALTNAVSTNELWLAAGTYTPSTTGDRSATFQLKNGVDVFGGFAGTEITRTQRNATLNVVTLSGDIGTTGNASDNSYHVVTGATGAKLEGVTITAGNAVEDGVGNGNGGGMYNYSSSPALKDVYFKNNAAFYGGGMYNNNLSSPTLTNVTFSGNTASRYGGGMTNIGLSSPTLTNVTFSGNSAGQYGGAICDYHSSPILTNVTIVGNSTSDFGGAMANWTDSTPQIRNSIIWGNTAPHSSYQIYDNTPTPTTITYSIVQGGVSGTGNSSANPLLGTLGNYGGSMPTIPLLPGSPAINAGSATYCLIGSDQRGVSYVGTCDMGAFESRGFILSKTGGDNQSAALNTAFTNPLTVTLAANDASEPIGGGKVTFTPPATGATAVITGSPVTLDASGVASVTAMASGLPGSYNVVTSATGVADVSFTLSNYSLYLYAIPGGATSGYCESWANACELRYALLNATSGQEIWVKTGTYTPTSDTNRNATFQLKNGVAIYGGFAGTETTRDQRSPANFVTLSGDIGVVGDATDNSFHVVTGTTGAILDYVTISGGNASSGNCPGTSCGGGMYNYSNSPVLKNVIFSDNAAQAGGGAMYNNSSGPQLTGVTFLSNSTQGLGGAMYGTSSSPTLTDVFFENNSANDSGGAMYNRDNSSPLVTRAVFSGNTAVNMGGAIYNYNSSNPALTRVTFSNNSAASGGGIRNYFSSPNLTYVTFSGNKATGAGGAIYNIASSNPTLTHVTVSGNTAPTGGGMHNSSTSNPQVRNSIFWGNTTGQITNSSSSPSVTYSIIQGGWAGTGNSAADPLLGTFDQYGSFTSTFPLLPGSAAINAGNATYCTLGYDQRGMGYVGTCDMGAFESQGFTFGALSGNNQKALIETAFTTPLGLSITAHNPIEPVAGGQITFTPPATGASAAITGSPVTLDASGAASVTATANSIPGSYSVIVSTTGVSDATFSLTNLTTILYVISGGLTDGLCESWANACELRYALTSAAAGQEIWIKAGTYQPTSDTDRSATFLLKNGVAVYGGFAGAETARDQRDLTTNLVTLSGDIGTAGNTSDNSYHVVTGASGATLDGVTISGGNANGSGTNADGGGMYNQNSSPTLINVIFNANSAQISGGGMSNDSSSPTLTHVTFSANSSFSNMGGGGGMVNTTNSSPILVDVTFNGNSANSGVGGGMCNSYGSNPSLTNVTFSGNSATYYGGGVFNYYSGPTLTNVTFNANSGFNGGAIYNSSSNPTIQNSILWGNTGGQIYNTSSTPTVRDSVVQGGYAGGTNIITGDPLLGTFGNYGGSTRTIPLLPGASAIDSGNATYCTLGHDQRNVNYVGTCDIGAFESQGFVLTKTGGDNQTTYTNTAFALPLAISISANVTAEPVTGGKVTFSGPASGASVASVTQTGTIVSGTTAVFETANGSFGSYLVTASASGANSVTFALSNITPPLHAAPGGLTSGACENWVNACELQYALSTSTSGQEIWAKMGTYLAGPVGDRTVTFQLKNGVALYGGFAGSESSRDARNWNAHVSILSGDLNENGRDANDSYHVVTGSGTDATTVLDGFTISGGYANSGAPNNAGAGMYIQNGTPTLRHLIFSGNATGTTNTFAGGGLYIANSSPVLSDLTFNNNYAYNGAGMYLLNSSPSMTRATFRANQAGSAGGGLYNASASAPTLTNVIFSGNTASAGAGVYNSTSAPKLYNVSFAGNTGTTGAALRNQSTSRPVLKNVIIWGNSGTAIADGNTYNDYASVSNSIIQGGYSGASNIDPLFVDPNGLDDIYGTADDDLRLTFGSPAIETGTNTVCPSGDLDDLTRPNDGNADGIATCDMGAYEAGEMICTPPFTFANQSGVSIQATTPGNLACLYVDEMEVSHVHATKNLQTGRYWLIHGLQSDRITQATGFSVTLTLPAGKIPDSSDKVCRYTGSDQVWDCALTDFDAGARTLTRAGVTAFSDWAVEDATPTNVTLHMLSAYSLSSDTTPIIFGLLAGLVLTMVLVHQSKQRS